MVLPLLGNSCVQIKDYQFCSPIPGSLGAVCDNFLTSAPVSLTQDQWVALQASWNAAGEAVECTSSNSVGDIKSEIEKLCSITTCDYPTQQAQQKIIQALNKVQALGKDRLQ